MGASVTLETIGLVEEIERSGRYEAVRPRTRAMDKATQSREIRKLGNTPDYFLGSVHALTEDGSLLAASLSGSQLSPYASGAGKVLMVSPVKGRDTKRGPRKGPSSQCSRPLGRHTAPVPSGGAHRCGAGRGLESG